MENTVIILLVCLTQTRSQMATLSPDLLAAIFGGEEVTSTVNGNQPVPVTETAEHVMTTQSSERERCVCVPNNFCDQNGQMTGVLNVTVTGWGLINERFGDNETCQEKGEICCQFPKNNSTELSNSTTQTSHNGNGTPSKGNAASNRPTDGAAVAAQVPDEECKCVPYYYCDKSLSFVYITNASLSGWGVTAPRLGAGTSCPDSLEMCCTIPTNVSMVPPSKPDSNRGCGRSNPKGLDFTIADDSKKAGFGEYPWVVALLVDQAKYIGVGVLIHPNVVMTAAHVVVRYAWIEFIPTRKNGIDLYIVSAPYHAVVIEPLVWDDAVKASGLTTMPRYSLDTLIIRAGEWDTQTTNERLPHQVRAVTEVHLHKDFINVVLFNDIALLKLDRPIEISEHINVICLPEQNADFGDSRDCVANGWGKDMFGKAGHYAVILKRVIVNMVPDSTCQEMLRRTKLGPQYLLHHNFVCAGGEKGEDSCEGDGGAPLACPTGDNRYTLAGLVSWGIGCGEQNVPGVYTKVSKFRNWIDDKLNEWGYFII